MKIIIDEENILNYLSLINSHNLSKIVLDYNNDYSAVENVQKALIAK